MQEIPMYTVDAFSNRIFKGNSCAVCIFNEWPDDSILQKIAKQNMFAETAFIVNKQSRPELRWFTVSQEVDFCGYGTLSAAYVWLNFYDQNNDTITFDTKNYGSLSIYKNDNIYNITVGTKDIVEEIFDNNVFSALSGTRPQTMHTTKRGDLLITYRDDLEVSSIKPNFNILMNN